MISLRVPGGGSLGASRERSAKRSSTVMSALLQLDRLFRAVGHGQAGLTLEIRRHATVAEHHPVTLVVVAEQGGGQVVAAAVALATLRVDPYLHLHGAAPVCTVAPAGARALATRASSVAHSSSPTVCMSGVTSAPPMASSRQKWASASGDSPWSSSPPP